jgi:hypothetical protein
MANFFKTLFGKDNKDVNQSEKLQEIIALAEGYSGGWPKELSRDTFNKIDFKKLTAKLLDYVGKSYCGFPTDCTQYSSQPEYKVVGGKAVRLANAVQDIKLVKRATLLSGSTVNTQDHNQKIEQYGKLAFKVIEYYAQTTLAKFLFLLPTAAKSREAIAKGKKAIVVDESLRINVYKGIENVLFEIHDGLKEGGHIDDDTVIRKLLSMVEASKL